MQPDQPFDYASKKKFITKPICWTNTPDLLSETMDILEDEIKYKQEILLFLSLLNSEPVKPDFLREYEQELTNTATYMSDRESVPVKMDEK